MKKVISLIMVAAMLLSLFTVPAITVSAAGTTTGNANTVFLMDFDNYNPEMLTTDGNVSIVGGDEGNAAKVVWNEVGYGGAVWQIDEFDFSQNTVLKFDILNNGAGNNVNVSVYDKNKSDISFRFKSSSSAANYVPTGTWYTYIVHQSEKANSYVAYRKAKGTATWEPATVEFHRTSSVTTPVDRTNTFRFAWGSSSAGGGAWLIDNVAVYEATPAISAAIPEDVSKTKTIELYSTTVDDGIAGGTVAGPGTKTYPDDDPTNMVIDYNCADYEETYSTSARTETFRTGKIAMPTAKDGFYVHFDFRRVEDQTNEWIQIVSKTVNTAENNTCVRIPVSQFTKGVWYTVTYKIEGDGTKAYVAEGTVTNKATGEKTNLVQTNSSSWSWTSQAGNINFCLNSMDYNKTTNPSVANRGKIHYQFDNIRCTREEAQPIKTEMVTTAVTNGEVKPLLVAYDSKGVMTAVAEGGATALETIAEYGAMAEVDYDVVANVDAYKNAKSVKVLYWDSFNNAKAYADAVEIGDAISAEVKDSSITTKEIAITADMIPEGANGNYTVFAYTVPFPITEANIPDFDAASNKILAIAQSETAPASIKIDSSLYNGDEQDIVILCNADGATAPKATLYEENDAPAFTNISMLLGADESERNFTWYSLDGSRGKLTYQKKSEMIDGAFTDDAIVVDATRTHDDSVYSTKEYYYNNQAVMTGLEANETYVYQLSNGGTKSKMYTITMADDDSTFSFAFGGDAQVGGLDNATYEDQKLHFGRTIKQMTEAPEFEGVEFFVSAGDQIESASTIKDIEAQYDIYLNHEQWATFPMAATLGNHDAKPAGTHMQHFNEPNKLINPATGTYYGLSGDNDGVDYYYVYNSVLFMHINLNTFDDLSNGSDAARADDKADAEEHIAFMKRVYEETADNKDILWKVVVCHQSPFGGSYHGNYTKKADGTYSRAEQYDYINEREYLLPYLYESGVDLVLSGHDHTYTRTHIIKPNENDDVLGDELNSMVISPYANTSGANYYTYADGTTTPTFTAWTDKSGNVFDGSSDNRPYLKVASKPVKVTDPDGFFWVTGSSSSGSQVNGAEYPNHYAAVCEKINQRSVVRFDVSATNLKMTTYNLGTNTADNDPMVVVDQFEIEKTTKVDVQGVSIPETAEIAVGQTLTLDAKLSPAQPTNKNVTWSSDNEAVAKVENGVVTAVAEGTANITVTTEDGGFTDVCAVTVVAGVPVTEITLPETATVEVYETKTILATVAPETATTKTLKWTSSDETLAIVDNNGNVTAHKHGEVTITAEATDGSGVKAECIVTITYTPATRTLNKTEVTLGVLETDKLTVTITPNNATYKEAIWVSSDSNVVEVNAEGELKAIAPGTATVSAVTGEGAVDCAVTVTGRVTFEQTYEDSSYTAMMPAAGNAIYKRIQDADGNWVLKVDGSGLTSSNKVGSIITNQFSSTKEREVPAPSAKGDVVVDFDVKKMTDDGHQSLNIRLYTDDQVHYAQKISFETFEVGEWYDVRYIRGADGSMMCYYKKSTDSEWIYERNYWSGPVFQSGSTISGQIHYGYMAFCPYDKITSDLAMAQKTNFYIDNMRVYSPVATEGMTLAESSANLEVGETAIITPVFTPANATDGHVAYTTSDANIATVDRYGKVTAMGGGVATITAKAADGGYTATYTVTVKAIVPEITVVKDGTKFTVTTNVAVDGEKVYVAAYNASNVMIGATLADYVANGTELTLSADGATYYKAFIWGKNAVPVISEKLFN